MIDWLTDTFVWTSVMIAVVLLLRRPVARTFGPQVAYALWALPLLRLLLPPVVLPASFAPVEAEPAIAAVTVMIAAAPVADAGFAFADLLVPLWLGGALLFLVWRTADYLRMRRELLADARPVGEAGSVRLVETPEVSSPVAFGLRDKVVALPPGFMAQHDLAARDLALAHELAHHRGHDLLANLLAQPLLALHWFNPLAWAGWRAMRSDQEAACDARVIAGCAAHQRAAYAQVIATFAAGPRLALAAPMACPVLGEKSIIHRLRSLTMSDVSSTRRKAGLAAIATGALVALPMTASISYAQAEATPEAPAAPRTERRMIIIDNPAGSEIDDPALHTREVRRPDGTTVILRTTRPLTDEEAQERVDRATSSMPQDADGPAPGARRFVLRREGDQAVADGEDAGAEAEAILAGIDPETTCAEGQSTTTRRELADGRQMVVVCRRTQTSSTEVRTIHESSTASLRQAQEQIRNNDQLDAETRDSIVRELDREITRLEAEKVAYAPAVDGKVLATSLLFQSHVMVVPAAVLRVWVPVAPLTPKVVVSDLPIS